MKFFRFLLFLWVSFSLNSQDFSELWEGYFSFKNITQIETVDNTIYGIAENAILSYNVSTNEVKTITTVDGLRGEAISSFKYTPIYNSLIIGYHSGLIEIYSIETEEVLPIVDIVNEVNIQPELKTINHINEFEGFLYISTDYGISVYDLDKLEFTDTYFIGPNSTPIPVNQTVIFNNAIYAACGRANNINYGIRKGELNNPNLVDTSQWDVFSMSSFPFILSSDSHLLVMRSDGVLFDFSSDNFQQIHSFSQTPIHANSWTNGFVFTSSEFVFITDMQGNISQTSPKPITLENDFLSSAVYINNQIYSGTGKAGLIAFNLNDFNSLSPNSPLRNNPFRILSYLDDLWVTYGEYSNNYNSFPRKSYGMSFRKDDEWNNIPFENVFNSRNLCFIAVDPNDKSHAFISSFEDGLLELQDYEPIRKYDITNSDLESLVDPNNLNYISLRLGGLQFDDKGLLWTITSRIDSPLKSFNPSTGAWNNYDFTSLIPRGGQDNAGFGDMIIDQQNNKWLASFSKGVIAYNESLSSPIINIESESQGMPTTRVTALELDHNNSMWIGTENGLRVLFNASSIFENNNPTVNNIVILDNGIPKELLENQFINDIKVDGSNNKWVAMLDSGVFYFSPTGENTIYHFTMDNSPLPSNNVRDISIHPNTGTVYFATERGLLSFNSGSSGTSESLKNAYVYPNPVRPEYNILGFNSLSDITKGVKIRGLSENVNIKITDVAGNLVAETQSNKGNRAIPGTHFAIDGGTAVWNGLNFANKIVATGVYIIHISDLDNFETKTLKLLIVR